MGPRSFREHKDTWLPYTSTKEDVIGGRAVRSCPLSSHDVGWRPGGVLHAPIGDPVCFGPGVHATASVHATFPDP